MTPQQQALAADLLARFVEVVSGNSQQLVWHSSFEIPEDGRYVIKTSKGIEMWGCVCNGAWLGDVKWWLTLPPSPDEKPQ